MGLMEEKPNSMLYWYPKLREIDGLNLPKTVMVDVEMFPDDEDGNVLIGYDKEELEDAVEEIGGYPVFIRTDKASAKHSLEDVSKVYSHDELHDKVHMLADDNLSKGVFGIEFNAVVVREWLDIKHKFKAFHGNLPIGYEIRAFIRDGKIECKHFYWIKNAIEETSFKPNGWEKLWEETKGKTMENFDLVERSLKEIAKHFDGWWSVDYAFVEDDKNPPIPFVIDMARGEDSFHHPTCKYAPQEIKEQYGVE